MFRWASELLTPDRLSEAHAGYTGPMSSTLSLPLQATDTVVMLQARDALGTTALMASLLVLAMFLAVLVILVFELRKVHVTLKRSSDHLQKRLDPILERGLEVTANMEFISSAVRMDVQRVSESVRSLSDRLQGASDRMEERIQEFNALMEVVQEEAEDVFIGSAAAARGVRAGARVFRGPEQVRTEDDTADSEDAEDTPPQSLEQASARAHQAPEATPGRAGGTGGSEASTMDSQAGSS